MPLTTEPNWDSQQSCVWFEIPYKTGSVLCRIDSGCFMKSLGAKSSSETACRMAFGVARSRIYARALAQIEAGHLNELPNMVRKFVWLTDNSFPA
jgi:hypothetical protein